MYRVLICEDAPAFSEELRAMTAKALDGEPNLIDAVYSGAELREYLNETRPDILLMDIELPDGNGIELVNQAFKEKTASAVIYITAYPTYCQDVYRTPHVWFLLKPLDEARFSEAMQAAITELKKEAGRIFM